MSGTMEVNKRIKSLPSTNTAQISQTDDPPTWLSCCKGVTCSCKQITCLPALQHTQTSTTLVTPPTTHSRESNKTCFDPLYRKHGKCTNERESFARTTKQSHKTVTAPPTTDAIQHHTHTHSSSYTKHTLFSRRELEGALCNGQICCAWLFRL